MPRLLCHPSITEVQLNIYCRCLRCRLVGDPNLGLTYQSAHPLAAALLSIAYVFTLGLVLMNLLISLMTTSLSRVWWGRAGRGEAGCGGEGWHGEGKQETCFERGG